MKYISYEQLEKVFNASKSHSENTYAAIDNLKDVGNKKTPVYFDENGVPKPAREVGINKDFFDLDENEDYMPALEPTATTQIEMDEDGDLMPASDPESNTSATVLRTARTISLSGAVTGSASFDGSADINIETSTIVNLPTSDVGGNIWIS